MSLCICAKSLCTMLIDLRPFYTLTSISRWPSVTRVGLHNTVSRPPVESGGLNPALRRIGYCMFCCATCTSELLLHRVYVQYTRTCICTARTDVVFYSNHSNARIKSSMQITQTRINHGAKGARSYKIYQLSLRMSNRT